MSTQALMASSSQEFAFGADDHAGSWLKQNWLSLVSALVGLVTIIGVVAAIWFSFANLVGSIQSSNTALVAQIAEALGGRIDELYDRIGTIEATNQELLQRVSAMEAKLDLLIERGG